MADEGGLQEQTQGEPSLGWTQGANQDRPQWLGMPPWGSPIDGEQEHDGREPHGDEEPEELDDDRFYVVDPRDPIDQRKLETV